MGGGADHAARGPGAGRRRVGVLPEHPAGRAGRQCVRARTSRGGRSSPRVSAATGPSTGVSVADLRTPADLPAPVRSFRLTARQESVTLPSGRTVEAWTFGSLPGPEIRVQQGDLVEVTLENTDIADGVTLHWHGYPVPNGEDGVAGVTQDAVAPGQSFTYRFLAKDAGTYWYHAHQVSSEAVSRGLFGALVVEPAGADPRRERRRRSRRRRCTLSTASPMVGGTDRVDCPARSPPGTAVRLRLINTDADAASHLGRRHAVHRRRRRRHDLIGPTPVTGRCCGSRPAAGTTSPSRCPTARLISPSRVRRPTGLRLDPGRAVAGRRRGSGRSSTARTWTCWPTAPPAPVPGMTDAAVDREATLVLDRQFRFLHGIPDPRADHQRRGASVRAADHGARRATCCG